MIGAFLAAVLNTASPQHESMVVTTQPRWQPLPRPAPGTPDARSAAAIRVLAGRYGLAGEYTATRGPDSEDTDLIARDATISPSRRQPCLRALTAAPTGRWGSVTEQVIAKPVVQEFAAGRIDPDWPVGGYLPRLASPNATLVTVRQLLRHQSRLPSPDDTTSLKGAVTVHDLPQDAGSRDPLTGYCAGPVKSAPGGAWSYNTCDYVVAGALLEAAMGNPRQALVRERIAGPLGLNTPGASPTKQQTGPGIVHGHPQAGCDLTASGAAAGLFGSAKDVAALDRALLACKVLPAAARAEIWAGQDNLGSIALGRRIFTAPLGSCAAPVRIVERRGQIGGADVRNFILPAREATAIVLVQRSGFAFGEVWQGQGFGYDLLATVAGS